jgi:hypothetical protein
VIGHADGVGRIPRRWAKLRDFAAGLGIPAGRIRVAIENDAGNGGFRPASAYKRPVWVTTATGLVTMRTRRPVFARVLLELQTGKSGVLICDDVSRIARDERDALDLIDACELGKASAFSPSEDSADGIGSLRIASGMGGYGPERGSAYRCDKGSNCATPAIPADQAMAKVMIARFSQPDIADLLPAREPRPEVDVKGLRAEAWRLHAKRDDLARLLSEDVLTEAGSGRNASGSMPGWPRSAPIWPTRPRSTCCPSCAALEPTRPASGRSSACRASGKSSDCCAR